jgi:hypothetical protein
MDNFTNLVLSTYRQIEEHILKESPKVYRNVKAINAGIKINSVNCNMPEVYKNLKDIKFIDSIILSPPFIVNTKKNTRKGIFTEEKQNPNPNPIKDLEFNPDEWLCYPAKVGPSLVFVYFNRNFMAHGIALSNLFELADKEEYEGKKPDAIFTYGVKDDNKEEKTLFFSDKENDIMYGYINHNENIDYFGYVKKMILTLHNVKMIEKGCLPIHGAMVNLVMEDGKNLNIIIMGDSGAGKSETLEALRKSGKDCIKEMNIIFDDMGYLDIKNNEILGYGTEI